jgi:hypothetical protein
MASITGFGGIFLRADDPKALYQWYERHLGLVKSDGSFAFPASTQRAQVIFALFKQDNAYFPPTQKAMINLQVDDLDDVLDRLSPSIQNAKAMTSESLAGSPIRKEIVSSFGSLSQLTNADPTRLVLISRQIESSPSHSGPQQPLVTPAVHLSRSTVRAFSKSAFLLRKWWYRVAPTFPRLVGQRFPFTGERQVELRAVPHAPTSNAWHKIPGAV